MAAQLSDEAQAWREYVWASSTPDKPRPASNAVLRELVEAHLYYTAHEAAPEGPLKSALFTLVMGHSLPLDDPWTWVLEAMWQSS